MENKANPEDFSFYKYALDNLNNPVCITDLNRNIVYLNKSSLNLLKKSLEECLGKPCRQVWDLAICGTRRCGIECLIKGINHTGYYRECKHVKIDSSYLKDAEGEIIGYMEFGSDVTEIEELTEKYEAIINQRKTMEQELRISEERLREALERNFTNVFDYDIIRKIMMQPDYIALRYGLNRVMDNMPESIIESGVICEDSIEDFRQVYSEIERGVPSVSKIIKTITKDGEIRFNRFLMTGIVNDNGIPVRAIGLIEDITKQQNMENAFLQEAQYRNVMLLDVIYYFEMNLTKDSYYKNKGDWNIKFEGDARFCYRALHKEIVKNIIAEEYKQAYSDMFSLENAIASFNRGSFQFSLECQQYIGDGKLIWVSTTMNLIRDLTNEDIKGFMYVKDIDEKKKKELELLHASCHDPLTGLLNKTYTENLIRETLQQNENKQHAFLILDVDHFKTINDNYGHYIGDYILLEVANSLKEVLGTEGFVGRIGGDEFVIFVINIPSIAYITDLAQKICENFWSSLMHKEDFPVISCSIGISISMNDGNTFEDLYRNADTALYKAKQLGRNQFVRYNSSLK